MQNNTLRFLIASIVATIAYFLLRLEEHGNPKVFFWGAIFYGLVAQQLIMLIVERFRSSFLPTLLMVLPLKCCLGFFPLCLSNSVLPNRFAKHVGSKAVNLNLPLKLPRL